MGAMDRDVGWRSLAGDGAAGDHAGSAGEEDKGLTIEPDAAGRFDGVLDQS